MISPIDWKNILTFYVSPFELMVRGSVMYLALVVLLRVILKRQFGTLAMTDLLLIVLLADASQNAMAGEYKSLPDGIVLVGTLIFWNFFLDWLSFRSPLIRRLIEPPPLLLIKDGELQKRNMRREMISEDELMMQLRLQGIDDLKKVKQAHMESDGKISVIEREQGRHNRSDESVP
jgi:uncharacterized membrane protein YcaP (DUF421 family)